MVDLRQAISQDLIRFHIVRDSDRRCSYLFTNGICGQYTSIISRERMLCHISQSENDCNHGSGFEQRNKATRQCQTFCFHSRRSHAILIPPQRKFHIASIAPGAVLYPYNPYSSISKYLCFTFCLALKRFTLTCSSVRFSRVAIFL